MHGCVLLILVSPTFFHFIFWAKSQWQSNIILGVCLEHEKLHRSQPANSIPIVDVEMEN